MKQLLFSVVCILAFSFCRNKTIIIFEKDTVFKLSEHYSKFRFHDLKEFKIDSLDYEKMETRYKKLDSVDINQIVQDEKELLESQLFYYSSFSDTSLIALIGYTNDEIGLLIWLLKYDIKGKLKEKIVIASSWGDAGDAWHTYSKLKKNNTFIRTHVSESMIEDYIETSDIQLDSTITKIQFQANNKLKIDTLFKNQEIIKQ